MSSDQLGSDAPASGEVLFGQPSDVAAVPEVVAAVPTVQAVLQPRRGRIDKFGVAMGTGRRKTSVARVRLKPGTGKFEVNGRPLNEYFCVERDQIIVQAPIHLVDKVGQVDVWIRVDGGGTTGQAGASLLGIARALEVLWPAMHQQLGEAGYLTRDSRMVERKKYGFKKARRSFQFSKR